MKKLIAILGILAMSTATFADEILETNSSLTKATASTIRITSCQNSYNSASLEAVPFLLSLARIPSRSDTPACRAAISAFREYNSATSEDVEFEVLSNSDEEIQVDHSAPTGKACNGKFLAYLISHCEVKAVEK